MQNKTTYYQFILDASGSMSNCRHETLQNLNLHLKTIQNLQNEFPEQIFKVSLTLFNTRLSQKWQYKSPLDIPPLPLDNYNPDGSTALLDAIGTQIHEIQHKFGDQMESDEATVVMVILTDGEENSSRFYDFPFISKTIKRLEKTGKWTFTFLGTDIDAFHVGEMLSIKRENTMQFDKREMGRTFNHLNNSLKNYSYNKQMGHLNDDFLNPAEENI
jgi:von Willebrand factor type A domain